MTRIEAERLALEGNAKEPKSTGLTFAAARCLPMAGEWYVAGYYKGRHEVAYVRDWNDQ